MMGNHEEPGSFYICTETSPRCYIIQRVSAKHVDEVVDHIKCTNRSVASPLLFPPEEAATTTTTPPSTTDDAFVRSQSTPPPLPCLPWWFTTEAGNALANSACITEHIVPDSLYSHPPPSLQMAPLEVQIDHQVMYDNVSPGNMVPPPTHDELVAQLRGQLEYYFSRDNLANDRYLRSQMDKDQYVAITVLAAFPKVARLTADEGDELIVEAVRGSCALQVDETGERVRCIAQRCTIILRDMAATTEKTAVESLFTPVTPSCKVEYGLNNVWYATFDDEETTKRALYHLQCVVKTFNHKPIYARIKTGRAPQQHSPSVDALQPMASPQPSDMASTMVEQPIFLGGNQSWTPSPANEESTGPLFDLGPLLQQHGFQLQGIYRPTPLLQVPPTSLATPFPHRQGQHSPLGRPTPIRNSSSYLRQPLISPLMGHNRGRVFSGGARGRGRGGSTYAQRRGRGDDQPSNIDGYSRPFEDSRGGYNNTYYNNHKVRRGMGGRGLGYAVFGGRSAEEPTFQTPTVNMACLASLRPRGGATSKATNARCTPRDGGPELPSPTPLLSKEEHKEDTGELEEAPPPCPSFDPSDADNFPSLDGAPRNRASSCQLASVGDLPVWPRERCSSHVPTSSSLLALPSLVHSPTPSAKGSNDDKPSYAQVTHSHEHINEEAPAEAKPIRKAWAAVAARS